MSLKTVIHSNAFNFMSFVNGSVDPRTGQYSLSIDLPSMPANDLNGPEVPLRLAFNPLNNRDSGFGVGWNLVLSQFRLSTGMLDLHSGESFHVVDNGPGQPSLVPERKVESFHFHNVTQGSRKRFRVAHQSGLVEFLEPQHGDDDLALPTRILAPSGHAVTLIYTLTKNGACLESIVDDTARVLLRIDYVGNDRVAVTLHPGTPQAALYTLVFSGDKLHRIVLPSDEKASWTFAYKPVEFGPDHRLHLLQRVESPLGAVEFIYYDDRGHGLPGRPGQHLPYVVEHSVQPHAAQPEMKVTYAFSTTNFLGYGSGIQWEDNGRDNLYKVAQSTYAYMSTASHHLEGKVVRTVQRTFNRFHLLTHQVTTERGCVLTEVTKYHEVPNVQFSEQPAYFQLPDTVTTRWTREDNANDVRQEVRSTRFDAFGNQVEERQPNGICTVTEYHPPALDPEGFVRHVKQRIVHPAQREVLEGEAPTLAVVYGYTALPGLAESQGWLVMTLEQKCQLLADGRRTALRTEEVLYHEDPLDPLHYGRVRRRTATLNGLSTVTDHDYEALQVDGHRAVQTRQTITGHDHDERLPDGTQRHSRKVVTAQHSVSTGEPLLERDDNDVEIRYEYDLLRRVTRETVAPGTAFVASRQYRYTLVASPGKQATQTQIDVKGVATLTLVDGLNRVLEEHRQDPDFGDTPARQQAFRQIYAANYDGLGHLVDETEIDWHRLVDVPLRRTYRYDGWGNRCQETGPDGVVHHDQTDPIGAPFYQGPVRRQWRTSAEGQHTTGQTLSWMNVFGAADRVERVDAEAKPMSLHQYYYDGLGRSVREVDASRAETRFAYDAFDRLVDKRLPDDATVHRKYAAHSPDDLPVRIEVRAYKDGKPHTSVLGHQRFDGLDRQVESITGGRKREYHFDPGQRQPSHVITARGERIDYTYNPQLGDEPATRSLVDAGIHAVYTYDQQDARLKSCTEQDMQLTREYFSTGAMKLETCRHGEQSPYEMHYVYSRNAKLLAYTDVLGNEQTYSYDAAGRLESTQLGQVTSAFTYDALGRLKTQLTQDGQNGEALNVTLVYDAFDRETERHFQAGRLNQVLAQRYDATDRIVSRTLREGERTLREEAFDYDERGRLVGYTCSGEVDFLPVDAYGNTIEAQDFRFDALNNITRVRTQHALGRVTLNYHFENAEDPAQLTGYTVTGVGAEPHTVVLVYDADGNLIEDEAGRRLDYDGLGRLRRVCESATGGITEYGCDPLDRLALQRTG